LTIEHFEWTAHAELRLGQRRLTLVDVERAIRARHDDRQVNEGRADWLVAGVTIDGVPFEAVYDHPVAGDEATVRIVSVWRVD
jgi:hypothetical protein